MPLPAKRYNNETLENLSNYIAEGGESSGLELSDKHQEILIRCRFADEKLRENRYKKEEIANFIKGKFGVCRDTAYKDIVIAEHVFSSSTPLNKKYEIQQRIEFLKKKINECYIDKDTFNAASLEKVLQKYYDVYPDFIPLRSPKNITYVLNQNIHVSGVTVEQAVEDAEALIIELKDKDDY